MLLSYYVQDIRDAKQCINADRPTDSYHYQWLKDKGVNKLYASYKQLKVTISTPLFLVQHLAKQVHSLLLVRAWLTYAIITPEQLLIAIGRITTKIGTFVRTYVYLRATNVCNSCPYSLESGPQKFHGPILLFLRHIHWYVADYRHPTPDRLLYILWVV